MPIDGARCTYYSFVRGRAMSFARNEVSQYLGNPLVLPQGQKYAYQKRVARKKLKLYLFSETLALTPNH
ncbi:hypothetical protein RYX36_024374, partial [Vicia faba]